MNEPKDKLSEEDNKVDNGDLSSSHERVSDDEASRRVHRFVWGFGVIMVVIAGGGFIFKLIEFLSAFNSGEPFQFSIIPVMTYLIVAAGFGCLFMWAYLAGQFKDIEGPKYRMLEMQDEFDRQGQ